ncbi:MAG TPA: PilZ domain-containing protein [Jatrophihabitans sp.]|nr:PilZ domain-containing protein [Jatrophihabitans sp.]
MPTLPELHRLVTVSDIDGRTFPSRIEDLGPGMLVLARPLNLPLDHEFAPGRLLFVSWPDPDGLTTATGTLVGTRSRGPLGLWDVQQVGELGRSQRRQFVRVPALGPIELLGGGDPGAPFAHLAGHLLDLSEAGLRCAVRREDARRLAPAMVLTASFALEGKRFELPAQVLRSEPDRRDADAVELVLTFDIGEADAAELRRLVFAEQLRQRRESA